MSGKEPERTGSALCLRLLGAFELRRGAEPLPRVRTRFAHWLLALLALRPGQDVERSWLAAILWPESPEARAYHSLRSCLADLRGCLGPDAARLRASSPSWLTCGHVDFPAPDPLRVGIASLMGMVAHFDWVRVLTKP